jgi:hypothetical protein
MAQIRNGVDAVGAGEARWASKSVTSIGLNASNLFIFTGTVRILAIVGRVTTGIQNQATSVKLQILADALAAYDICAAANIQAFAAGSALTITGTAAGALVGTTAVGAIAPGQANAVLATCVTSGYLAQHSTAASTGAITWEVLWHPVSAGATLAAV